MRILYTFLLVSSSISFFSCQNTSSTDTKTVEQSTPERKVANTFVASLEKAHHVSEVLSNEVIAFDLKLIFGGREAFNGTITSRTDSGKIKMKRKSDNAEVIFDGKNYFITPDTAEWKGAPFSIFTWQYFFMAPYKLSDPGTKWDLTGKKLISGQPHETGKLSFNAGTGNTPNDWYLIYQNPKDSTMSGMAYIVTAGGTSQEEAEKNAHAIYYRDYQILRNGMPIASNWDFFNWNEEDGYGNTPIGTASISNVRLLEKEGNIFNIPEEAKNIE